MINYYTISNIKFVTYFLLITLLGHSCNLSKKEVTSFTGDEHAVIMADQMFEAIGGKDTWCNLTSLYIKAEHTEPQMTIPYQSEIWRAIDTFEVIIEQQNDSFHVKGVFTSKAGTIRYYDKRDTSRVLTDAQLADWKFGHEHNVYVLLHNLGCNPQEYRVKSSEDQRIDFYQDTTFVTGFGLDDDMRPHLFYQPNSDGTVSGSRFTHWGVDNGLVHSAGGHPLDSNFMYITEIWQPSQKSLSEAFGDELFRLE